MIHLDYLISVKNSTALPIERGGREFPPKTTTEIIVSDRTLTEIRARKGLEITAFRVSESHAVGAKSFHGVRKVMGDRVIPMARKVGGRAGLEPMTEPVQPEPEPVQDIPPAPEEPAGPPEPEPEKGGESPEPEPESTPPQEPEEPPADPGKPEGEDKSPDDDPIEILDGPPGKGNKPAESKKGGPKAFVSKKGNGKTG